MTAARGEPDTPIRRIVLWRWNRSASPGRRLAAKEGLAYIRFGGLVDDLDYGEDIGLDVGPGEGFDLVLLRDHVDRASWDAYVDDPHHKRVGDAIDAITDVAATARIDYRYAGPASVRGRLRHIALYHWRRRPGPDELARLVDALDAARAVAQGLAGWACGADLDLGTNHADFVIEAHFEQVEALRAFFTSPAHGEIASQLDGYVEPTRTVRIQQRMLTG